MEKVCLCVPQWEVNKGVQFIPHISVVGEAFQVDHQHWWQRPQVQFLSGLLVLLTVWTVPTKPNEHFTFTNADEHKFQPLVSILY